MFVINGPRLRASGLRRHNAGVVSAKWLVSGASQRFEGRVSIRSDTTVLVCDLTTGGRDAIVAEIPGNHSAKSPVYRYRSSHRPARLHQADITVPSVSPRKSPIGRSLRVSRTIVARVPVGSNRPRIRCTLEWLEEGDTSGERRRLALIDLQNVRRNTLEAELNHAKRDLAVRKTAHRRGMCDTFAVVEVKARFRLAEISLRPCQLDRTQLQQGLRGKP